jgi:hypothetical protein
MPTTEQLQEKSAQAYQVIGYLDAYLHDGGDDVRRPTSGEMQRALDYFCDVDAFNEYFLPWPEVIRGR